MIWVGSFKSLQLALHKPPFGAPLEVHTWLRSETDHYRTRPRAPGPLALLVAQGVKRVFEPLLSCFEFERQIGFLIFLRNHGVSP